MVQLKFVCNISKAYRRQMHVKGRIPDEKGSSVRKVPEIVYGNFLKLKHKFQPLC